MNELKIGKIGVKISRMSPTDTLYTILYQGVRVATVLLDNQTVSSLITRQKEVKILEEITEEAKQLFTNVFYVYTAKIGTPKYKRKYATALAYKDRETAVREGVRIVVIMALFQYIPITHYIERNRSMLESKRKEYMQSSNKTEGYGYLVLTYDDKDLSRMICNDTVVKGGFLVSPVFCNKKEIDDMLKVNYYSLVTETFLNEKNSRVGKKTSCVQFLLELNYNNHFSISSIFSLLTTADVIDVLQALREEGYEDQNKTKTISETL